MDNLLTRLRQFIMDHYDLEDLRTLCFDLGVNYDALPGEGTEAKAREIVAYLDRRRDLPRLIAVGKQVRPDIDWDALKPLRADTLPTKPLTDKLVVVLD